MNGLPEQGTMSCACARLRPLVSFLVGCLVGCIPVEKTLRRTPTEFCVQVNSASFSIIFRFLFVCGKKLNTLQMVSSLKKGKTIHREARETTDHVNHQCKQEAVNLPVILPICLADIGTANICGVSVATVKQI
jgi:hypothetical protein